MDDFRLGLGHVTLDFVATLGRRAGQPIEKLTEPADLTHWLTEAGLLDADGAAAARPSAKRLADALALREATYRILEAARAGSSPKTADVDLVNRHARGPTAAPQIGRGLKPVRSASDQVAAAITELARDGVELLTGPDLQRVRQCDGCSLLFVDRSRPGTRRWCSMDRCGNRSKTARYRSKRG